MNNYFNLYHLKFFCDVVTYGSVQEAAKKNLVTQSAVSQAIGKLETLFGLTLICYSRQKLYVTEEGNIVYKQALEIFKSVQNTFVLVDETKKEITGTVRFITTKSLGMSFLPPLFSRVEQELPKVKLQFKTGGLTKIRTLLKREELDFAIVVYDNQFAGFEKILLKKGQINLYHSKKSDEKNNNRVFIDEPSGMYVNEISDRFDQVQVTGSWDLAARFTDFGMGVGFFPDYIIKSHRYPNVQPYKDSVPMYEYEICVIKNKGRQLPKAALSVIENFSLE